MVKEMLSVLMDGIKDAGMLLDYAYKAKMQEDDTENWFTNHARKRIEELASDYQAINNEIGLEAKAATDEIACALMCHLKEEILQLKNRL